MKKRTVATLVVVGLVLTACGGDDGTGEATETAAPETEEPSTDTADAPSTDTADAPSTDTADAPSTDTADAPSTDTADAPSTDTAEERPTIDRDATLRVAWVLAPRMMDPHRALTVGDYPFLSLVYDRLIGLAPDESLVPMLATEWEFVDGGTALELQLQEGVVFHDGEPFNAEAVAANIERAQTLETSTLTGPLAAIVGIEVLDEYRVRFELAPGQGASLLYSFTERPGMIISPAAFDNPLLDQTGVGTGPYVVKEGSFQTGVEAAFVRADGEYWGGDAFNQFAEIHMQSIVDLETRLNALESGQINLAHAPSAVVGRATQMAETGEFNVAPYDARSYHFLAFNTSNENLADPRVRQAIAHAIDKQAIVDAIFEGYCTATAQMPLETDEWFAPDLTELYAFDPDESRRLLEEAGVPDLTLTAVQITNQPTNRLALAIQGMLANVGIDLQFTQTLASPEAQQVWEAGETDLHIHIAAGSADPVTMFINKQNRNFPGGVPEGYVELLNMSQDPAATEDERLTALSDLNRLVTEGAEFLYVCNPVESLVGASNIVGLDSSPWMRYGVFDVQSMAIVEQ